jgi:hypothetical protein
MVIVKDLKRDDVQQAIAELEDMLKKLANACYQGTWLRVDAGSTGIPTGAGVRMTGNSTVDLHSIAGYVGVNIGAPGVAGGLVLIQGGPIAEVFMIPGENPQAGNHIYYSLATPGGFTIAAGTDTVGTIYDRHLYDIATGGLVKVFLDRWFDNAPPP